MSLNNIECCFVIVLTQFHVKYCCKNWHYEISKYSTPSNIGLSLDVIIRGNMVVTDIAHICDVNGCAVHDVTFVIIELQKTLMRIRN